MLIDECLLWLTLRYVGVICLHFLIGDLYMIGVWRSEDQRTSTMKTHFKGD